MAILCTACGETKPEEDFGKDSHSPTGRRYGCLECNRKRSREYYAKNLVEQRVRIKTYHLEVRHGLGSGGYERLLKAQGGGCALCGTQDPGQGWLYFPVDHDHQCCPGRYSCGKCVRGLLCDLCNRGLGMFKDDPERLERAVGYLRMVR